MKVLLTASISGVVTTLIILFLIYSNNLAGHTLTLDCISGDTYTSKVLYEEYNIKEIDCDPQGRVTVTASTLKLTK